MPGLLDRATKLIFSQGEERGVLPHRSRQDTCAPTHRWPAPTQTEVRKPGRYRPGFFVAPDCGGYFAMRSFASDCPIELNTDKVWLACLTSKNLSALLAQYFSTAEVASPPVLT